MAKQHDVERVPFASTRVAGTAGVSFAIAKWRMGGLPKTGPTHTNVMELRVALVGE